MDELKTTDNVESQLTPQQYFERIKDKKYEVSSDDLKKIYENCLELANKYRITGQIRGLRKILFCMESIEKEQKLVDMGITTFVYKDDIGKNDLEQNGVFAQDLRDYLLESGYANRGYIVLEEEKENGRMTYDLTESEDEFTYTVDYTKFIPLLIKGWQEQKKEIDALKDRVNELTNLVNKLLNIGG